MIQFLNHKEFFSFYLSIGLEMYTMNFLNRLPNHV